MEYYNLDGKFMRPRRVMSMHRFRPPNSHYKLALRFGLRLPPSSIFSRDFEFYNVAPIQLSPNNYRLAIDIYMMYVNLGY